MQYESARRKKAPFYPSPRQRQVLDVIESWPPATAQDIADELQITPNAAREQLRLMTDAGVLITKHVGLGLRRAIGYSINPTVLIRAPRQSRDHIVACLKRRPQSIAEVARELGAHVKTTGSHMRAMLAEGVLAREKTVSGSGRRCWVYSVSGS